jgi:hypothetical protein
MQICRFCECDKKKTIQMLINNKIQQYYENEYLQRKLDCQRKRIIIG